MIVAELLVDKSCLEFDIVAIAAVAPMSVTATTSTTTRIFFIVFLLLAEQILIGRVQLRFR